MKRLFLALAMTLAGTALAQQAPKDDPAPTTPEQAQQERRLTQPGNNAPVWREVQRGTPNYTSLPGREMDVLIQPPARFLGQDARTTAGEAWRQFRNGPITFYGGWLVLLVVLAILAFYFAKGPVKLHDRPTGRLIRRFSTFEQVVHWSAAISFCVLGLSGLIMLFGKYVLLPVFGYTLFAWLAALSKNLHNFIAPLFIVSVILMIPMWLRDNLPRAYDWQWFRKAWAFFARGEHIPSGRFNGGEKAWFWLGVIGLSIVVIWSGLILLFPNFDQTRAAMQDAWVVHVIAALVYIAMSLGHIYMGTIGVEGAYGNMRNGYTDETWAREHHSIWYDEVKSKSRTAPGGAVPAGAPHMKEKA
jgi:formate dehydrogenase subunit gamma